MPALYGRNWCLMANLLLSTREAAQSLSCFRNDSLHKTSSSKANALFRVYGVHFGQCRERQKTFSNLAAQILWQVQHFVVGTVVVVVVVVVAMARKQNKTQK